MNLCREIQAIGEDSEMWNLQETGDLGCQLCLDDEHIIKASAQIARMQKIIHLVTS